MSIQSDIYTAITTNGTLAALVGTRVFPYVADGSAASPYVTFQIVGTSGETTHDGEREIEFPLVQFNVWSTTDSNAAAIANAIDSLLDGNTIAGTSAATFRFSNRFGQYEQDTKLFGEVLEYQAASTTN